MEPNTIIIILGTAFTLLILALTMIIVVTGQKKKSKLELQMQRMEVNRQKEIAENTLISQEQERQKVGLELHDELGPTFAAVRLNIDRIQQKIKKDQFDDVSGLAKQSSEALETAIGQFSDISKLLYPVILIRHGLTDALHDLVDKANFDNRTEFSIAIDFEASSKEIINLTLYRVCQELITNAHKHANATIVTLNLSKMNNHVHLQYSDNGKGFATDKVYSGLGLNSIKGRVEAVGGKVVTTSAPNKGVNYQIDLPYD
ncbi:MAG: two-component system NarL family sensor kinase [bacterium]|jgi:two-component system NarL family sensor kinase